MAYDALYNRWRPQDFDTLVGQKSVKTALSNAIATGRIAHAYLFTGPRGTGKTSTARIFAKALNCEQGMSPHPCGHCNNCEHITKGTSMDVIEMDAASKRGIDDIKALREQISFAPVEGRYKILIIDEVHMLTTEAFNAFLKTLEEPPENVIFILATTDPQKIPATIHSRCQRFNFHRITVDEITEHLLMIAEKSGIQADKEALRLIAIQSEGGMRDSLSLLDQCSVMSKRVTVTTVQDVLGILERDVLRELVKAIGQEKLTVALDKLNTLIEQGKDTKQILTELSEYLRALLLYKAAPTYQEIYLTDNEAAFAEIAPCFGQERLIAAEERLHKAMQELRSTMRPKITAELCILDLCRQEGSTLAALAARVERLEYQLKQGSLLATPVNESESKVAETVQTLQEAVKPATAKTHQTDLGGAAGVIDMGEEIPLGEPSDYDYYPDAQYEQENYKPEELVSRKPTTPTQNNKAFTKPQEMKPAAAKPQTTQTIQLAPLPSAPAVPVGNSAVTNNAEPYTGDWATGEDYWKRALELLKQEKKNALVSCAQSGRVYSFVKGTLTISFKAAFLAKRMGQEDYRKVVENAILRNERVSVNVVCVPESDLKGKPQSTSSVKTVVPAVQAKPEAAANINNNNLPEAAQRAIGALGGLIQEVKRKDT